MTAPEAIVVGAGPAGLAAAQALCEGGAASVLVVDRDDAPGGLPRFCNHPGFGWEFTSRIETGPRFAHRMIESLDATRIRIATRTTVLSVVPGPEVQVAGPEFGHVRLPTRAVVLATGTRERPRSARLVPGRRPEFGVLNTGQLQQLVARGIPVRARRAVVVGSEHVAFSVLATARCAGISVTAILEPGPRARSFAFVGWLARTLGTAVRLNSPIEEIVGSTHVEAVVVREANGLHTIPCDLVVFSGDFVPDAVLAAESGLHIDPATGGPMVDQTGRTNIPGVYATGNVLRAVESSGWAAIEGMRVGRAAAAGLRAQERWRPVVARIEPGAGVAYVVPQLWSEPGGIDALPTSLRAAADFAAARLSLLRNGEPIWLGRSRSIRRDRRLALPRGAVEGAAASGGSVRIAIS